MKFGPAGNSNSFINEGHKSSIDAPRWLSKLGLDIYEYSFGRGVRIGEEHAKAIAIEAVKNNIQISVHAPYYINFASNSDETMSNSISYLLQSLVAAKYLNAVRCVVHPGSPLKQPREEAYQRMMKGFAEAAQVISDNNFSDLLICPETMGKINQMGTLDEILGICQIADFYVPCIDFGHLNSRNQGNLKTSDDYRKVFDKIFDMLGENKARKLHIHFSHIEYGQAGEIRHLTFDDEEYGPFFEDLAPVLQEYKVKGWLVCESRGTQAEDAKQMKGIYNSFTTPQ